MAKGYWIAHNQIADVDAYEAYKVAAAPTLRAHGAKFLVRAGSAEFPEGSLRPRTIVIEFPSLQAAQDCNGSETYKPPRQSERLSQRPTLSLSKAMMAKI